MRHAALLAATLLLAGCGYQHQTGKVAPAVTRNAQRMTEAWPGVRPGATLRLFAAGRVPVEGTLVRIDSGAVIIVSDRDSIALPSSDLDSAWVYREHTGKGAAIGAGIVGGLFALMAAGLAGAMCDYGDCATAPAALMGGVVGVAAGGAIGALAGLVASGWQPVYRAPRAGR